MNESTLQHHPESTEGNPFWVDSYRNNRYSTGDGFMKERTDKWIGLMAKGGGRVYC